MRRQYLAAVALALALVASCSWTAAARAWGGAEVDATASGDRHERPQPVPVVSPSWDATIRHGLPQNERLPSVPALRLMVAKAALAFDDDIAEPRPAGALEPRELVRRVPTARYVPRPRSDEPG